MLSRMADLLVICGVCLLSVLCIEASCVDLDKSQSRCYSRELSPNRFYGTKTTYSVAKAALDSNTADEPRVPANCQPIMLYFVGRHAIRYPDGEDIVEMSRVLSELQKQIITASEKGLTQLCEQDLHSIRNWELKMNETDDNRISDTGVRETQRIGMSLRQTIGEGVRYGTPSATQTTADSLCSPVWLSFPSYFPK